MATFHVLGKEEQELSVQNEGIQSFSSIVWNKQRWCPSKGRKTDLAFRCCKCSWRHCQDTYPDLYVEGNARGTPYFL